MTSVEVRQQLVDSLRIDLVGPDATRHLGTPDEVLPQAPSRWYLTGFLVPLEADDTQRVEETSADEMDEVSDTKGLDDAVVPEPAAARLAYMPSSIGLSVLVAPTARHLRVTARWGDYRQVVSSQLSVVRDSPDDRQLTTGNWQPPTAWKRTAREEQVALDLPERTQQPVETDVPNSNGLRVVLSIRPVTSDGQDGGLPQGVRSVSVFLVNRRTPAPDVVRDEAFAFQTELEVVCDRPLVPRPNLRSLESDDWDERVGDLQYRDAYEFAVGHSVAAETVFEESNCCRTVRTCWIPQAEVERVAPVDIAGVELGDGGPQPACGRGGCQGQTRQLRRSVPGLDQEAVVSCR